MKVVIATYDFLPSIGGVATTEAQLATAFVEAGHEVTVATLSQGPVAGYGYRVVRQPGPLTLFRLYRGADLLILSNLAIKMIYPLLLIRRSFALRHHSESAFRLSRSFFSGDALRRFVRARARHFVTSAYIGRVGGLPGYVVTPPFANMANLGSAPVPPAERQGALFVGRVEPEKGVPFLLDHWPTIRTELGVGELRIVGSGSIEDDVRARIASEGLDDVTYVGRLPFDAVARERSAAAYVLVPSLWQEPFGAVALEAVAAGATTIVADRGGLAEAVGDLGFMFDPDDARSLASALRAARVRRAHLMGSERAWADHRAQVDAHVARFHPSHSVDAIVRDMTLVP